MNFLRSQRLSIALAVLLLALLALKYGWTLFAFPQLPIGYDAGIYRFLFVRFADALPPFSLPDLPPWGRAHPLGLFFFSSLLLQIGFSADVLIGPFWNIFQIALFGVLALSVGRKYGRAVGLLTLMVALLSTVQYEGFLFLYWKVMFALLCVTLAFAAYRRHSPLLMLWGMLTIAVHQQIGVIYILSVATALLFGVSRGGVRSLARPIIFFVLSIVFGLLWYASNYSDAIFFVISEAWTIDTAIILGIVALVLGCIALALVVAPQHRMWMYWLLGAACAVPIFLYPFIGVAPEILRQTLEGILQKNPGVFLSLPQYFRASFPLILLGVTGFIVSLRHEKGTPEQAATLWSALGMMPVLFFHRRFILPLDFFLLPFAALGILFLWKKNNRIIRGILILLLALQAGLLLERIQSVDPGVTVADLQEIRAVSEVVEPMRVIVSLDTLAPWVLGLAPQAYVLGPGIFDSQPEAAWRSFLYGTEADRRTFIDFYARGSYFYGSRFFRLYYPPAVVHSVFGDTCFAATGVEGLYESTCGW